MNKSNNPRSPNSSLPPALSDIESGLNDLFLVSARQDLAGIEQALERRDYGSLQDTVHRLKGAAMIFRMTPTVNAALHIEAVLNTGLPVEHARLVEACALLRQLIAAL
ncbi:Hpt domain-containing protein [Collimonas arenae]|nr:Hpt domain-containing protein [Collimonas arenae]